MAPLPPSSTHRVWVDYFDGYNPHSLQIRHNTGLDGIPDVLTAAAALFDALSPVLWAIAITGARYASVGSNISFPVTWTGDPTYGTFTMPGDLAPRQICYLARDSAGRRVRWFLFGYKGDTPADYRIGTTEIDEIGLGWAVIQAAQVNDMFLSIAGLDPVLYPYVDINYNSYYEAKAR